MADVAAATAAAPTNTTLPITSATAAPSSGEDAIADAAQRSAVVASSIPSSPSVVRPPPKTVFFIRHAESAYNAFKMSPVNWLTLRALADPMIFDPPLSPVGLQQLIALGQLSARQRLTSRAQLLICSPLRRAIDTALALLGDEFNPALKALNTSPATSPPPPYPLPVLISPLITEVLDTSADIGSDPSTLSSLYPALQFGHLSPAWWYHADPAYPRAITDEPLPHLLERLHRFSLDVMRRPEHSILVVSHSSFIKRITGARTKIANCVVQECRMGFARDGQLHVQVVQEKLT